MDTHTSIFRFETADKRSAFPGRIHYHDIWEIYYLTSGSCRYFIDKKTYRLNAGDLVVIPPGIIHKVIYDSDIHSRMLINCSGSCIPPSAIAQLTATTYFSPAPHHAQQIKTLYARFQSETQRRDEYYSDITKSLLAQLLILLVRARDPEPKLTANSPFVEDAVQYIHENFSGHLSLTDTARRCAVSPEHLSRVFKRETGFGFNEYVNIYRLKRAEAMLKSGEYQNVSQVSGLCGFPDSNYFSKAYKKLYGIPPSHVKKEETDLV